jgi:hypothetical protein
VIFLAAAFLTRTSAASPTTAAAAPFVCGFIMLGRFARQQRFALRSVRCHEIRPPIADLGIDFTRCAAQQ